MSARPDDSKHWSEDYVPVQCMLIHEGGIRCRFQESRSWKCSGSYDVDLDSHKSQRARGSDNTANVHSVQLLVPFLILFRGGSCRSGHELMLTAIICSCCDALCRLTVIDAVSLVGCHVGKNFAAVDAKMKNRTQKLAIQLAPRILA